MSSYSPNGTRPISPVPCVSPSEYSCDRGRLQGRPGTPERRPHVSGWRCVLVAPSGVPVARRGVQLLLQLLRGDLVSGARELRSRSDVGLAVCRGVGLV